MSEPIKSTKVVSLEEKRVKKAIEDDEPDVAVVINLLEETVVALKSGKVYANKVVVILVEDNECYLHTTWTAGMIPHDGIVACSLALDDMKDAVYSS